jgi:hypothetical protein
MSRSRRPLFCFTIIQDPRRLRGGELGVRGSGERKGVSRDTRYVIPLPKPSVSHDKKETLVKCIDWEVGECSVILQELLGKIRRDRSTIIPLWSIVSNDEAKC